MGDSRADEADALLSLQSRQPGRNAFAEDALRHNRYMLGSNAFCQQEFSARENTPPTMVHPALRHNFDLLDTSVPLPKLDPKEVKRHMALNPRDSDVTTMSPFLAAGLETSPVLNLGTTPENTPQPTQRAFVEDRREQQAHEQSGRDDERVPVYRHTPKPPAEEFATPQNAATKKADDIKSQHQTPATRSPKKGFFSRLGWSTRGKSTTPQPAADNVPATPDGTHMSVKARAVLVDAPPSSKRNLIRSPSKPKGLFSRRTSDAAEVVLASKRPETPRAATSLGHRTPQNITWQLPRSNSKKKLSTSTKHQDVNDEQIKRNTQANTVGRSHSLKGLERIKPPTPPAKDTPPEVREARKLAAQQQSKLSESTSHDTSHDTTPTRQPQSTTPSVSITPTPRQASFGHRGQPTLITQPSMYSLRASVVPDAMEKTAFNEAKSRMNALGIEGFNMPEECNQGQLTYSPSVYSPDAFRKSVLHFPEHAGGRSEQKLRLQASTNSLRDQALTAQDSHSTTGTIPVMYPELAKDPSMQSFMEYDSSLLSPLPSTINSPPQPGEMNQAFSEVQKMVKEQLTMESPVSPESEASTENLFAIPLQRTIPRAQGSPMSNHPSAMVSPLRNTDGEAWLPNSTFLPTTPISKKEARTPLRLRLQRVSEENKIAGSLPTPADLPWTPGGRPKPKPSIFDNRPEFVRPKDLVIRHSPPIANPHWQPNDQINVDPQKSPRARSPSPQSSSLPKSQSQDLEQLQQLSNTVLNLTRQRESDLEQLTDTTQAETARLHQRLASLEIRLAEPKPEICYSDDPPEHDLRRTSVEKNQTHPPRPANVEKRKNLKHRTLSPEKRISTPRAMEFYTPYANPTPRKISLRTDDSWKDQELDHPSPVDSVVPATDTNLLPPRIQIQNLISSDYLGVNPSNANSGIPRADSQTLPVVIPPSTTRTSSAASVLEKSEREREREVEREREREPEREVESTSSLHAAPPLPTTTMTTTTIPTSTATGGAAGVEQLYALFQQQQRLMLDMMREIRELRRREGGVGEDGNLDGRDGGKDEVGN